MNDDRVPDTRLLLWRGSTQRLKLKRAWRYITGRDSLSVSSLDGYENLEIHS